LFCFVVFLWFAYNCFSISLSCHFLIPKWSMELQLFFNFTPIIFFLSFKFDFYSINCYLFCLCSFLKLFSFQISFSLFFFSYQTVSLFFLCFFLLLLLAFFNDIFSLISSFKIKLVDNWVSWFNPDPRQSRNYFNHLIKGDDKAFSIIYFIMFPNVSCCMVI
jgi:hypothetical protein